VDLLFSDVVLPDAGARTGGLDQANAQRPHEAPFTSGYVDENILRRHGVELSTAFCKSHLRRLIWQKKSAKSWMTPAIEPARKGNDP